MSESTSNSSEDKNAAIGFILRVFWMFAGNLVLFVLGVLIHYNHPSFLNIYNIMFAVTLAALVAARYVDIVYFKGADSYGGPATVSHWRRYAAMILAIGLAAWGGAHALAHVM